MKKIFAFMKTALVAAVGLSLFSCSVDGNKDDIAVKDCGSLKFSIAIPKFMVPDNDSSARMVMPSTSVIKLTIEDGDIEYAKEFSVSNSGLSYEDYTYITAELDDVPIHNYPEKTMLIELYDSKENLLTHAYNTYEVDVTAEKGTNAETVVFYTLPATCPTVGGTGTDEETGEEYGNEFEVNDEDVAENKVCNLYLSTDEETVANYGIYYEAYKVIIPYGYGLDVTLRAKNESRKEVAVVVYDEDGTRNEDSLPITVSTDASFNEKNFASIPMGYGETRYIVLYTKGPLTGLNDSSEPELLLTLTEEE